MGLHKPFDRDFFVIGGNVMTSGGSLQLAKGQIGLFNTKKVTADGMSAVSTLLGIDNNTDFVIKQGVSDVGLARSKDNKPFSTAPFKLSEVVNVRVSAPSSTQQKVDELIIGYNGVDDATAITFTKGDRKTLFIRLSGEWVGALGYPDNYVDIEYTMEAEACEQGDCADPDCDTCDTIDCAPIVISAIEFLKNYELRGGVKVSEAVDITPITSCDTEPTYEETPMDFQTLTLTDTGDENALALVQAQYPDYKIVRINRYGTTSVYQTITPDSTTLDDYELTIASILKGCEDCPEDYTAGDTGLLYAVSIQDNGSDLSTTVDDLPGFVTGTTVKQGQENGIGFYTLLIDDELTDAEIATFLAASATKATATITLVGDVATFCNNTDTTDTAWVVGDSCNVTSESYKILLPDNECGETRLAELQAAYPDLTISISQEDTANSQRIVTLTGTSGTANITVTGTGTAYLATFNTSLTQTATDFVTTHAADLLADEGITVTSSGATIIFTHATTAFPTITAPVNASGDLAGTIAAVTVVTQNVDGGCQTQYETTVISNLVCEECDPIFNDYYVTQPPADYDGKKWVLIANETSYTGCLCGIRIKAKEQIVLPEEFLKDTLGFVYTSTQIEASGGYITEQREGLGLPIVDEPFNVEYLSRWAPKTHMGGNLWQKEKKSHQYFTGNPMHTDHVAKLFMGELSAIEAGKQYIDYAIDIRRVQYAQSMSGRHESTATFHIWAEVGKHTAVEAMVNRIAAGAGLPGVKA